jgi:TATA-box binding protein (TBP) (component of TFIID and TFIIIB)
VFITGKMEIPGIVCDDMFELVKIAIVSLLQNYCATKLHLMDNVESDNILINSNFNCGHFINRQILYHLLSKKYNIETSYDPCTYPGIKCKYYFIDSLGFTEKQRGFILQEDLALTMSELHDYKKYTEVSIMIFRTGSCLIVGNCSENIIRFIFTFIKNILRAEYDQIVIPNQICEVKKKKQKIKRKNISFSNTYYLSTNTDTDTDTNTHANIIPK